MEDRVDPVLPLPAVHVQEGVMTLDDVGGIKTIPLFRWSVERVVMEETTLHETMITTTCNYPSLLLAGSLQEA